MKPGATDGDANLSGAHDLSRLRIDRDRASAGVSRALKISLAIGIAAVVLVAVVLVVLKRGGGVTVQATLAIASRAPEIGVPLTLGFKPGNVLSSFLVESVLIALIGGILGGLVVLFAINGLVTSTTNWNSFSEVAFAFRVTPALLLSGLVFSVVMGALGGFFPARRAAKQQVIEALRAEG
jgi:putative ABC transport system permease protein